MIQHLSWNAELAGRLDQLKIIVGDDPVCSQGLIVEALEKYGFAFLSGLQEKSDRDDTVLRLLALSSQLGEVLPQSPLNERVEDIRDFSDVDVVDNRGYRSTGELTLHSDPPTLILLHCLQPAKQGGESYFANVRAIHDAIKNIDQSLLETLYQGFPYWLVEGQVGGPGPAQEYRPIFTMQNDIVSCVTYRPFIEKAATAMNQPLRDQQIAALDLFDSVARSPAFAVRKMLQSGDTLILHNRSVLHARTDFEDWPNSTKRRHLLRVWIDAPALLPASPIHELGDIFSKP